MNGNSLVGVRSLIGFMASLTTITLCAYFIPEQFAAVTIAVVSLFSLLLGRKKEEGK